MDKFINYESEEFKELLEKVAIIGRTHGISYEQMANILKLFFEE